MEGIVPSFGDSYMKQRGDPASQVSFRHGDYSSTADSENLCPRGAMPYACRGQISTTRRGLDGARQTHVTRSQRVWAQVQVGRQMWTPVGLLWVFLLAG